MTAAGLEYHVFLEQRDFNKLLSPLTADLHCQLQSPRQQRWDEPVCSTAVPLQRDLQKQCGGWHGPVKPHIVQAWRKTRPLCEWLTQKDNELHTDVYRKQLIRLNNCLCVLFQVVIKYVPYVGDSKRAMDEYTSEIMMGGTNTIALHNTCEVSVSVKCVTKNSKSSRFRAISNFLSVQTANCWLN